MKDPYYKIHPPYRDPAMPTHVWWRGDADPVNALLGDWWNDKVLTETGWVLRG